MIPRLTIKSVQIDFYLEQTCLRLEGPLDPQMPGIYELWIAGIDEVPQEGMTIDGDNILTLRTESGEEWQYERVSYTLLQRYRHRLSPSDYWAEWDGENWGFPHIGEANRQYAPPPVPFTPATPPSPAENLTLDL